MPELGITNDKIFVGIPRERTSMNAFIDARDRILATLDAANASVGDVLQVESHRVDLNRESIVRAFLSHSEEPDWLLMLDSDMDHPPDCGLRLRAWREPIVGGLYFHRSPDRFFDPMAFSYAGKVIDEFGVEASRWTPMRGPVFSWLRTINAPFINGSFVVNPPPKSSLLQVASLGTGCMLIHRSVLEKFRDEKVPPFEYRFRQGSEDLHFCELAGRMGFQSYVDLSTICGHYIQKPVGHPEFMNIYRNRGFTDAGYTERGAIHLLEAHGIEDAEQKMADYKTEQLGHLWAGVNTDNPADVKDFYRTSPVGDTYLFDLLWWNGSQFFSQIRSKLVGQEGKSVLEIGSGIGTVAIQLALQGCDVTALEINKVLKDFSNFRWATKLDSLYSRDAVGNLRFIKSLGRGTKKTWPPEFYDLIVAIDTFEHMHESDLVEMISYIARSLQVGGRLFCHNNWGDQNLYPMHFDHSGVWPSLMEDHGFAKIDDYWYIKATDNADGKFGSSLAYGNMGGGR